MEKAIKRAIEGGWRPELPRDFLWSEPKRIFVAGKLFNIYFHTKVKGALSESILLRTNDALNDPTFWQALGKAERWKESNYGEPFLNSSDRILTNEWENNMHNFIDHLIEDKPIDDFFNNLLK